MKIQLICIRPALFALGCALAVVAPIIRTEAAQAVLAKALPVAVHFAKDDGPRGPMVAHLTNSAAVELKVHVKVEQSVVSHNRPKTVEHDFTIAAGQSVTVTELALHDKVTVSAEGYESLTVEVK